MILRATIKNFLSIGEELEFTMLPYEKIKRHSDHVYKEEDGLNVLKTSAIYGANGSGKSNFMKAIHFIHDIVTGQRGGKSLNEDVCFRLTEKCKKTPTSVEIEFKNDDKYFAYGIDVINKNIKEEWLYQIFPKTKEQFLIFERKVLTDDITEIILNDSFKSDSKFEALIELYKEDRELLPNNKSLINILKKKADVLPLVKTAHDWFLKKLFIIYPNTRYASLVNKIINNEDFLDFANSLISKLDTGVFELAIEEISLEAFFGENDSKMKDDVISDLRNGRKGVRLRFNKGVALAVLNENDEPIVKKLIAKHKTESSDFESFDLNSESDGTVRLIDLIPAFELILQEQNVCFIDEIGRSLHPSLLKEMISYLLRSKSQGQLIFTTHESNLLDLNMLRQDEIWFAEKNNIGTTKMYPLSDYKPRYDLNIRKGYLNGRFGAIPFLADLENLIEPVNA